MSSNSSYQVLHNQDDEIDSEGAGIEVASSSATAAVETPSSASGGDTIPTVPPPPYIADGSINVAESSSHAELPPQYVDIVKLPTYNESENLVEDDNEEEERDDGERSNRFFFWFLHGDTLNGSPRGGDSESWYETGSDAAFMFSFLLALIFNWIGFLVSYCFTRSLASYYGAISGFGISLVKWAFIAQHSEWSRDFMVENPWFCYAFVLFGWVIFMRGIFAYIQMKRFAYRSNSANANAVNGPSCTMFS